MNQKKVSFMTSSIPDPKSRIAWGFRSIHEQDDKDYHPEMVVVWAFRAFIFWVVFVLGTVLVLSGCASAPPELLKVQDEVRSQMKYEWSTTRRDVWNPHCPAVGDCEDIAMCMYQKLRKTHPQARLLRVRWWQSAGVAHVMVKVDDWWLDYNGVATFQPRGNPTHECKLDKANTMAICTPLLKGERVLIYKLSNENE